MFHVPFVNPCNTQAKSTIMVDLIDDEAEILSEIQEPHDPEKIYLTTEQLRFQNLLDEDDAAHEHKRQQTEKSIKGARSKRQTQMGLDLLISILTYLALYAAKHPDRIPISDLYLKRFWRDCVVVNLSDYVKEQCSKLIRTFISEPILQELLHSSLGGITNVNKQSVFDSLKKNIIESLHQEGIDLFRNFRQAGISVETYLG